jgi:hypothetical protein
MRKALLVHKPSALAIRSAAVLVAGKWNARSREAVSLGALCAVQTRAGTSVEGEWAAAVGDVAVHSQNVEVTELAVPLQVERLWGEDLW